jgi:hypothetical protein
LDFAVGRLFPAAFRASTSASGSLGGAKLGAHLK